LTPGLHPAFLELLRFLEQQDTEVKQLRAFKRFVRDYGTHYISSALMGSKVAAVAFYAPGQVASHRRDPAHAPADPFQGTRSHHGDYW